MPPGSAQGAAVRKPLSADDCKAWQQAIELLVGLQIRNGLGEGDYRGTTVAGALHR